MLHYIHRKGQIIETKDIFNKQLLKGDIIIHVKGNINDYEYVYTDGSSQKNGKKNSKSGFGVFWGYFHNKNISQRCKNGSTNNQCELLSIKYALLNRDKSKKLVIFSDSLYAINALTIWFNNGKLNRKNNQLIIDIEQLVDDSVTFIHVRSHQKRNKQTYGNHMADLLACKSYQLDITN